MLKRFWYGLGRELLFGLAFALFIQSQVAEARVVPSWSMKPTLVPGDRLFVEKITYRFTNPHRGDLVIFESPLEEPSKSIISWWEDRYVKRAIGLPGDTVVIDNGQVSVNGQVLTEPYIEAPARYNYGPVTVPEGSLFVLGDNRNNSNDSHVWGFVDLEDVTGRVLFRMWPFERIGDVD